MKHDESCACFRLDQMKAGVTLCCLSKTGEIDRMENKNRKIRKSEAVQQAFLFGCGFLILLFLQLFVPMGLGDDAFFAEDTRPLGEFLSERYQYWTSRLLIEAGAKLLAVSSEWIWRILNILIVMLLVWIAADIFGLERDHTKRQAQVFFFGLMWAVPMDCLWEAGWIATTLNYLWPLTLGLVAIRPVKHWVKGEKCSAWEYFICPLCMIFAANAEQCAAILLGVYLLSGGYLLKEKRKLSPFYFLLLGLAAASIAFILAAPGNGKRMMLEAEHFFPEYQSLNIPEKLLMGFVDTAGYYLAAGGAGRENFLFALLAGILLAGIWQKRGEKHFLPMALVAVFPLLFVWGMGVFGKYWLMYRGFRRGGHVVGLFSMNRCLPCGGGALNHLGWIPYSMGEVLLQAGVYLAVLACVALTIYFLHGRSRETLLEFVILGAGLLSRLILGFSPTIYASGNRTTLFCSAAILIVCLRNLQSCWNKPATEWSRIVLEGYIVCVICVSCYRT